MALFQHLLAPGRYGIVTVPAQRFVGPLALVGDRRIAGLEFVESSSRSSPARTRRSGTLACVASRSSYRSSTRRLLELLVVLVVTVAI
jgi:hypothetical protein